MDDIKIKLPAQLDLAALPALRDEIGGAIGVSLTIDGSDVERVGTPAVQLLLAAAKAVAAEGRSFALRSPSAALAAAFLDLGLASELDCWSAA